MAAPQITPLPTPPIRSDAPAAFATKADAFAASLPQFVTETNASAAFVDQRAIDADGSAQAAAASEAAAEADRAEVAANTATVASNTATVVARADEVAANTLQVAADTQQVSDDKAAVDAALASIAGGPVYSVNGMTGNVTGIVTQDGAETLTNKTLANPIVTLGGSQGEEGQVPVSQGPGLAPQYSSMKTVNGTSLLGSGDISAGGAWNLLSTVVANNSATVDLEAGVGANYDDYVVIAEGVQPSAASFAMFRLKAGGAYLSSSVYQTAKLVGETGGASCQVSVESAINCGAWSTINANQSYIAYFMNCNSSRQKNFNVSGADPSRGVILAVGAIATANTAQGFRFMFSTGSVVTGTFRLYGIKKN